MDTNYSDEERTVEMKYGWSGVWKLEQWVTRNKEPKSNEQKNPDNPPREVEYLDFKFAILVYR